MSHSWLQSHSKNLQQYFHMSSPPAKCNRKRSLWHCKETTPLHCIQKTESEHRGHLLRRVTHTLQACDYAGVFQDQCLAQSFWWTKKHGPDSWHIFHVFPSLTSTANMMFRYTTAPLNALINAVCSLYLAVESLGKAAQQRCKKPKMEEVKRAKRKCCNKSRQISVNPGLKN